MQKYVAGGNVHLPDACYACCKGRQLDSLFNRCSETSGMPSAAEYNS